MACYPCTHCNKCGMYSARASVICAACETPIPVGSPHCPQCGGKSFKTVRLPDDPSHRELRQEEAVATAGWRVGTRPAPRAGGCRTRAPAP